ncbi:MAG: hypothetical protein ACXW3O_12270 [Brevundimonas sp.]
MRPFNPFYPCRLASLFLAPANCADPESLMPSDSSNDNAERNGSQGPDAHGEAALLLVESLVHGLIAQEVITVAHAVEIVDVAAEVKAEVGIERSESPAELRKSLDLLDAIGSSLRRDLSPE